MNVVIGWPELIYLVLICLGLGVSIAQHGQMVERDATSAIIGVVIVLSLLYWGGFFS